MNKIGQRIRALRQGLGWTQSQLARHVRLTRGAVSQIETGFTHQPSSEHLLLYARALGVSVDYLMHGDALPAPPAGLGVNSPDTVARPAYRSPVPPLGEPASPAPAAAANPDDFTASERTLIDYVRANGVSARGREALARRALSLLIAIAANPAPDDRLSAAWTAPRRREGADT